MGSVTAGGRRLRGASARAAVAVLGTLLLGASLVRAGSGAPGSGGTARARILMGTRLSIETDGEAPARALEEAFDEVARLEGILSNWKRTSEISRLNGEAAQGPVRCSLDLFEAVSAALRWAADTGGAFDPTVEPLVVALGLRGEDGRLPGTLERGGGGPSARAITGTPAGIADAVTAAPPIGWRHVHLERRSRSVRFDAPGVGLDFGGIGKGIALDAAARVLRSRGVRGALLDFGGQVLAVGRPKGLTGWTIGIADPEDRDQAIAAVGIDGVSVATSSNAERTVATPGGRVGHILDPASERPARFAGSLTVAAQDATSADALSTALFVMGPDKGVPWAEARRIAALYLWRDGSRALRRKASRAFRERFGGWAADTGD
jgi:thiamine biosynthesis lipoprotein